MIRLTTIGVLAIVVFVAVGTGAAAIQAGAASGPAEAPTYVMNGPVEDAEPVDSPIAQGREDPRFLL